MVTAKSTELDTVVGLEVGADDYVAKPYRIHEPSLACGRCCVARTVSTIPQPTVALQRLSPDATPPTRTPVARRALARLPPNTSGRSDQNACHACDQ